MCSPFPGPVLGHVLRVPFHPASAPGHVRLRLPVHHPPRSLQLWAVHCAPLHRPYVNLPTHSYTMLICLHFTATMLAWALCVANPTPCPNPGWYSTFCVLLEA